MLSAIVLAAGSSRRMGNANKLLLPYKDRPVIAHTVESILAAGIEQIIVVTGHQSQQIAQALTGLPVRLTHNSHYEEGMTGSIQAGVLATAGQTTPLPAAVRTPLPATAPSGAVPPVAAPSTSLGYMICLSDMTLITPEEYRLLAQAFETRYLSDEYCILLPEYNGQKGNPVIFSSLYKEVILQHEEKEGCKKIVRTNSKHVHPVSMPSDHILRDIDSPEDYRALTLNS